MLPARIANRARVARCACARAGMATRAECDERATRRAEILAQAYARRRDALLRQAARHAKGAADPEDVVHDACAEFLRCKAAPEAKYPLDAGPSIRYRGCTDSSPKGSLRSSWTGRFSASHRSFRWRSHFSRKTATLAPVQTPLPPM